MVGSTSRSRVLPEMIKMGKNRMDATGDLEAWLEETVVNSSKR